MDSKEGFANNEDSEVSIASSVEKIQQFVVPGMQRSTSHPKIVEPSHKEELDLIIPKKVWQRAEFIEKKFLKVFSCLLLIALVSSTILVKTVQAKKSAEYYSNSAKSNMNASFLALDSGNIQQAFSELNSAADSVRKLKLLLQSFGQDITYLQFLSSNQSQIAAMERMVDASYNILSVFNLFEKRSSELTASVNVNTGQFEFDIKTLRLALLEILADAKGILVKNQAEIMQVQNKLPSNFQDDSKKVVSSISKMTDSSDEFEKLLREDFVWLDGEDGKEKKVLVIFQNNAELRGASGGSFGSFGIVKLTNGKLNSINFGTNIFKLDNAFIKKECIPLNNELKFVVTDGCSKLKDSGWSVDGQEALQNIKVYYEKITGDRVDGVLTLDTTAFISLLRITGPIEMKEYSQTITSDNFREVVEREVHTDYFAREGGKEENEPKKILADMMPEFINRLTSSLRDRDKLLDISASLANSLKEKNILFYFANESLEKKINKFNFGGAVMRAVGDYLYVNSSNINGFKSSLNVAESINLDVEIRNDGSIVDSLDITREHKGTNDWPDGLNRNYVRLLLPEDSKIQSFKPVSGNFERYYDQGYKDGNIYWVTGESSKEVVNFWMNTPSGKTSKMSMKYVPNYRVATDDDFNYTLTMQRQPGANPDEVILAVTYPVGFKPTNVKNYDFINRKVTLKYTLTSDQTITINFKKNSKEDK